MSRSKAKEKERYVAQITKCQTSIEVYRWRTRIHRKIETGQDVTDTDMLFYMRRQDQSKKRNQIEVLQYFNVGPNKKMNLVRARMLANWLYGEPPADKPCSHSDLRMAVRTFFLWLLS